MPLNELIFASANPNKHKEIQSLISPEISLKSPVHFGMTEDIPETGETLEENALIKARYLWERTKTPVFADDTGLEIEALQNAPGVYSARYAGPAKDAEANMAKVLEELQERRNRKAQFRTAIAYIDEKGEEHLFEGIVEGRILREKRGDEGFGYDPIFLPEGRELSFAEMSLEEKNEISHRARALRAFIQFLDAEKS